MLKRLVAIIIWNTFWKKYDTNCSPLSDSSVSWRGILEHPVFGEDDFNVVRNDLAKRYDFRALFEPVGNDGNDDAARVPLGKRPKNVNRNILGCSLGMEKREMIRHFHKAH